MVFDYDIRFRLYITTTSQEEHTKLVDDVVVFGGSEHIKPRTWIDLDDDFPDSMAFQDQRIFVAYHCVGEYSS